ncbi:hypothetical protein ABEB36_013834 [Hypothenemus hampei]|uniref:Uncharacterized protein n=1 Tax=Hypothenemus hampei TaxID=57062 RepID=A0ABD1E5E7_HYPHA
MATRVKNKQPVPLSKEVAMEPQIVQNQPTEPTAPNEQLEINVPRKVGRPLKSTGVKKTVSLKAKVRVTRKNLKINPKNFARVLLENGKGLERKKVIIKNGVKELKKPGRKPKVPKIKTEPENGEPQMELSQEGNLDIKKTPKKRGRKPYKLIPDLIKMQIKSEPVDDPVGSFEEKCQENDLDTSKPVKKPGRKCKPKADTLDEVMSGLSYLIDTDQIKKEADDTMSETKFKKLTKKARLEALKRGLTRKKENIENTLSQLDPAESKVIDQLDLNVRNIKSQTPIKIKRRHSIEKFPITSNSDLHIFSQLPRSISPRTSKRVSKLSLKRSSPYMTRSDSPARMLRNGKHRKLKENTLLDGLENPKRRRRYASDVSGSETASKLSGFESDSSFSDLASEKDTEVKTFVKDVGDVLIDDLSNPESKSNFNNTEHLKNSPSEPLVDTNSNVCKEGKLDQSQELLRKIDIQVEEDTPSAKVPEKGLLLDIMKQTFNDLNNEKHVTKCDVTKFYGGKPGTSLEPDIGANVDAAKSTDDLNHTDNHYCSRNIGMSEEEEELRLILEKTEPKVDANLENFPLDKKYSDEDYNLDFNPMDEKNDEAPFLEKQTLEKDDSLPLIENMCETSEPRENSDNLEPPLLESSIPIKETKKQMVIDDQKLGIAVTEKDNVVLFTIEHLSDDTIDQEVSNEDIEDKSKIEEENIQKPSQEVVDDDEKLSMVQESPERLAQKESIFNALGLRSLKTQKGPGHSRRKADKPSTSKSDAYTGTLKTVIKINKKKGKNQFKMTLQKKGKNDNGDNSGADEGYKIMKEGNSSSNSRHSKDSSDSAGAHRKSHYSNRSNMEASSEQTSDGEQGEKNQPEKSLIVPEKASSFSIHPGRLCKDECSYCFGKFGLFDTPCHIAQMKSVERQNKILASEKHLTRDSCLCDACYRHVDRKSNSPSYNNKSLKRNSLVAPGPKQNHCHVLGCDNLSTNILRRKWIIKMRKSICQAINIDLDNPGLHSIPICDDHYNALEHLMICAMCKRRLARNHIHYLALEVQELNEALRDEGIPIFLTDKPVVCKLCKCFASIILKDPEERMQNSANFFKEYKRRLLHFNDIVHMDTAAAEEPIVVPNKDLKKDTTETTKKRKCSRNSSNESNADKESQEDLDVKESSRSRVPSTESANNQSRPESPDDRDEYADVDYNTLIPAIAMDCPSDSDTKKDLLNDSEGVSEKLAKFEMLGNSIEVSRTLKAEDTNDVAAQKLVQNPSISLRPSYDVWQNNSGSDKLISNPALSVRQLFPGEEELGLVGDIDFKTVIARTPEGWEKCTATIQYDEDTKLLWQELQKPYGSQSSFLRHLILLEKYFRNGDLILSPTASHHAINYRESVHNRLRAYDNIPSDTTNVQPSTMLQFNKPLHTRSSGGGITGQNFTNGLPPVTISQIVKDDNQFSKTPITLQQLKQPPLYSTTATLQNFISKNKPPGLICINTQKGGSSNSGPVTRSAPSSQKIKFPITKNWRPNLIPIDPSKKNERKAGLVQVISGGKPYHITLEDYKKMCAIKRSFEAKQKKIQEQQLQAKQQGRQPVFISQHSVLKSKRNIVVGKTSGGSIMETKPFNLKSLSNNAATITSDSSQSILEKLDRQVERLGQKDNSGSLITAIALDKNPAIQIIPRIPKSLTVIPQTIPKSKVPSPIMHISKTSSNGSSEDSLEQP